MDGNNPTLYGYVKDTNVQADLYGLDVYALVAAQDGWYPVYEYGTKDPVAYTKLKKGDLYKIEETQHPKTRYSQPSLDKTKINRSTATGITFDANENPIPAGVTKTTLSTGGTKTSDRALENQLLNRYHNKRGELPPGNKHFH